MFNKVILIGRATRDPELRYTPAGNAVCTYHIAVDRPFTNSRGEREADFITIVAWSKLAEHLANYLRKGKMHAVEGRIQTRNYENNDGRRVYVTEVVAENVRIIEWPERNNTQDYSLRRSATETAPPETDYYGGYKDDARATDFYGYEYKGDTQPLDISEDDLPF